MIEPNMADTSLWAVTVTTPFVRVPVVVQVKVVSEPAFEPTSEVELVSHAVPVDDQFAPADIAEASAAVCTL